MGEKFLEKKRHKGFKSIRTRTFAIILPAFLVTLLIVGVVAYSYSRSIIQQQIQNKMDIQLSEVTSQINANLTAHGKVPEVLARTLETAASGFSLEQYRTMLSHALESNEDTFGLGIYFEPGQYAPDTQLFSTYAYRDGEQIVTTEQYSDPSYYYPGQAWYIIGKDKTGITDPYYDPGTEITMTTFAVPFFQGDRSHQGVITGDINLTTMQQQIEATRVGDSGFAVLLDTQGSYIAGPDADKLMKLRITEESNESLAQAGTELIAGERGMVKYTSDNGIEQLYYQKLPATGWTLGLTISEAELYAPLQSLLLTIILVGAAGLLITIVAVHLYSRAIAKQLDEVNSLAEAMAEGDFTRTLPISGADEFARMAGHINRMLSRIRELLIQVSDNTLQVASTSEQLMSSSIQTEETTGEVVRAIKGVASGADTQLQATGESARAMEEMSAGVQRIAESAVHTAEMTELVSEQANSGNDKIAEIKAQMQMIERTVTETSGHMAKLAGWTGQIGSFAGIIAEISSQTNMLALNASIEAARAGVYGRGFAVVAAEVKKLSEHTADAAGRIGGLIVEIQAGSSRAVESTSHNSRLVNTGMQRISEAGEMFSGILHGIREINSQIHEVSSSSEELLAGTEQLTATVDQLAEIARKAAGHTQNAASSSEEQLVSVQEVASASKALASRADGLQLLIAQFKVS
ncbi:Methyl-accepting chemotaxis protein McpA [compost metagenome]